MLWSSLMSAAAIYLASVLHANADTDLLPLGRVMKFYLSAFSVSQTKIIGSRPFYPEATILLSDVTERAMMSSE